ncbi:putative calcium-binding protein [Psilocybe cubensis]|uniref:Uncharacterized protein n=2 Tax=Psilocybe cubensis TaxID=181762 RepID=A0A8H7XYI7_PSICU|nr:putative calcium-binding protein [Psilocybe cubensis]KAH9478338.1 putative calcium-binding protein [Psilocybe cubensis]
MTSFHYTASEEEEQLANQILTMTDCHHRGVLSADAAIEVFKKSGLSYAILRDIWAIADANGSGDLSREELAVAIRLMGWVQAGEELGDHLLKNAGPLPTLEGITDVVRKSATTHTQHFPPLNPDDIRNFRVVFLKAGPVDGLLDGGKVMDSFMTSNLSYDDIWKIKTLVDYNARGALDFREFSLGMYLIQALQSCLISSVPTSFPRELFNQFPDLNAGGLKRVPTSPPSIQPIPGPSTPPLVDIGSASSANLKRSSTYSPTSTQTSSSLPGPSSGTKPQSPSNGDSNPETWEILPLERRESDKQFIEVDVENKGYIDGDNAARFMLSFGLPPEDLTRIWTLSDLDRNNRLTKDGFAIALHLIRQRLAGNEMPATLPGSLTPPPSLPHSPKLRMNTTVPSPASPTTSSTQIAKSKPPPPPPPKRDRSVSLKGPNGVGHVRNQTMPEMVSGHLSLPVTPLTSSLGLRSGPSSSVSSLASPSIPTTVPEDQLSPFEDPLSSTSSHSFPSKYYTPSPAPSPRPPDTVSIEVLDGFKKETARLSAQVESLLSQLTAQNRLRDSNEALRSENDTLKAELHEMERTVSEVLSASDLNGRNDLQEVDRLTAELANKEVQYENVERMLAVVTNDKEELRVALRESQQATQKVKSESEDLKHTITTQSKEIAELKSRLSDMTRAMSEPSSSTNNRELRVLIRDVTKENDTLKGELRNMQKSMEQLLLSTKFHARYDEVERENKRLKQHVQDLELIAAQSQSSGGGRAGGRGIENLTRENEQLKAQLRDGQRAFAEFRSASETRAVELQQKVDSLTHENNQLKIDVSTRRNRQSREDNSIPPPAYDDAFVIPP